MSVKLREQVLKDGRKSLYLDIYQNGSRRCEFLKIYIVKPTNTLDRQQNKEYRIMADTIRAKRELEIQNNEHGLIPQFKKQTDFIAYFRMLTDKRVETGVNFETWLSVLRHLEKFSEREKVTFSTIDDNWLEDLKTYLLNAVSQNSAHAYFNKVKAALHQAFRDKIIIDNPAIRVKSVPQVATKREFLTVEELQMVAKQECRYPVLKNAFLFSALTGLRWSDIQKLKWSELRHSEGQGWYIEFRQKKTKNVEYHPISQQARELLGQEQTQEERVFVGLKYSSYHNVALEKWMLKAGITKQITFHCARHTYAVLLLQNDVAIYTVSKLLGHTEIKTTEIYAKIVDSKKREAADKLPQIRI